MPNQQQSFEQEKTISTADDDDKYYMQLSSLEKQKLIEKLRECDQPVLASPVAYG